MLKFITQLLFLLYFCISSLPVYAEVFECTSGNATFVPAVGDTVIATNSCNRVTVRCENDASQCTNLKVFAAASDRVIIRCFEDFACQGAQFNIGIPDVIPVGYSESDFDGTINRVRVICGDDDSLRSCENISLKTFEDIDDIRLDCSDSRFGCVGIDVEFYSSRGVNDGRIDLVCGASDRFQCDASQYFIETAGAPFTCTGITCVYVACVVEACNIAQADQVVPGIVDPDGDGISDFYDTDDDNDGTPDVDEIAVLKEQDLRITPMSAFFSADAIGLDGCTNSSEFSLKNKSSSAVTISSVSIDNITADTGEFLLEGGVGDFCGAAVELLPGSSCLISVRFCPLSAGAKSARVEVVSDVASLSLALYSAEPIISQAQRRLAPVLSSIEIDDLPVDGNLIPGDIYPVEFNILGYQVAYDAWLVVFKCSEPDDGLCGLSFAQGVSSISAKLSGNPGASSWSYTVDNETVDAQSFTFNTRVCVPEPGNYVMRLFQRSGSDTLAGNFTLSLLIPGNLSLPSYAIDDSGRRLSFTAVGGQGICPP